MLSLRLILPIPFLITLTLLPAPRPTLDQTSVEVADDGARPLETVSVDLGGGVKLELVRIPKGKFQMGSPKTETERDLAKKVEMRDWDAEEQHEVEITRDFLLGKYPVTQEQYVAVMGINPSSFSAKGALKEKVTEMDTGRLPVENVSWDDAVQFCEKLSLKDAGQGRKFRLPTEAEWEYACRAGTTTAFHFGTFLNGHQANCEGTRPYGTTEKGPYLGRTTRVDTYKPNAFGLYDMHGNVLQWCADWYGPYADLDRKDPIRENKYADIEYRVLRGGSWHLYCRRCRAASRVRHAPDYRNVNLGFRVASDLN